MGARKRAGQAGPLESEHNQHLFVHKKSRTRPHVTSTVPLHQQHPDERKSLHITASPAAVRPPCQPLGNLLMREGSSNARDPGLGSLAVLPDELLVGIFGHLQAVDLVLAQGTSHAFFAFTRIEGQWKHEYLQTMRGRLGQWRGSWRRTYLMHLLQGGSGRSNSESLASPPTEKIRINDIYSDVLYVPYMAATYDPGRIVNSPHFANSVRRTDGRSTTREELANIPLILTKLMEDWPAYSGKLSWTLRGLAERFPTAIFQAENVRATLSEYQAYHDSCSADESPVYLFDPDFVEKTDCANNGSGLGADFDVPDLFQEDLFRLLGDSRPNYRWLIAGPARSGSTFHCDPNATSAWNAVVSGSKLWILFPPNIVPPGIHVSADQAEVEAPLSIGEWMTTYYAAAKSQYGPGASDPRKRNLMLEGVCHAGEIFYVPSGWWHMVVNLQDSIAVTQNFVSLSNLEKVLLFLRDRPLQISGFVTGTSAELENDEEESGDGNVSFTFREALLGQKSRAYAEIIAKLDDPQCDLAPTGPTNIWQGIRHSNLVTARSTSFSFDFGPNGEL